MLNLVRGRGTKMPCHAILFPCAAGGRDSIGERANLLLGKYAQWASRHEEQARLFEFVVGPMGYYARPALNGSATARYPSARDLRMWMEPLLHMLKPEPVYHNEDLPGHVWVPCEGETAADELAARMLDLVEGVVPGRLLRHQADVEHWGVVVDIGSPEEAASLFELLELPLVGARGWADNRTYHWE